MTVTQAQINAMNKTYHGAAKKTPSKDMGKDAFMQLFVAQLKNQDPLKPMSNKDSTAQMAQFAQLEQTTNMTKMLEGIAYGLKQMQTMQSSGLIGKTVLADGNNVSVKGSAVSGVDLDIPKGVSSVKVNVHDKAGNIVRTVDLKDFTSGKNKFQWDGNNTDGSKVSDGVYRISVVAKNKAGKKFLVPTQVEGEVAGVELKKGQQVLLMKDGREVLLNNVFKIVAPTPQAA